MSNDNLIHEERMDLFSVPKDYYIVHSISGDYSLGAGVAKKINKNVCYEVQVRDILS